MSGQADRWARLGRELAREHLAEVLADHDQAMRRLGARLETRREPRCTCGDPLSRHNRRGRCTHPQCPGCPNGWTPVRPGPPGG